MTTATVIAGFLQLTVLGIIYIMWLMRDKHKLEILQCELSDIKKWFTIAQSVLNNQKAMDGGNLDILNDISARVDSMRSDINLHIYNNGHHKLSEAQETAINNFEESMNKNNKMVSSAVEWMTERFMATDAVVKAIGCRVDKLTEGEDAEQHDFNSIIERLGKLEAR